MYKDIQCLINNRSLCVVRRKTFSNCPGSRTMTENLFVEQATQQATFKGVRLRAAEPVNLEELHQDQCRLGLQCYTGENLPLTLMTWAFDLVRNNMAGFFLKESSSHDLVWNDEEKENQLREVRASVIALSPSESVLLYCGERRIRSHSFSSVSVRWRRGQRGCCGLHVCKSWVQWLMLKWWVTNYGTMEV